MPVSVNVNGVWRKAHVQANVAGAWKTVGQVYVNVGGSWKSLWSYAWQLGTWGGCSKTCGGGTQSRTVTCRRNDAVTVADALCTKFAGTKPATSQSCNTQSCMECRFSPEGQANESFWKAHMVGDSMNLDGLYHSLSWNGQQIAGPFSSGRWGPGTTSVSNGGYTYTPGELKDLYDYRPFMYTAYSELCRA